MALLATQDPDASVVVPDQVGENKIVLGVMVIEDGDDAGSVAILADL